MQTTNWFESQKNKYIYSTDTCGSVYEQLSLDYKFGVVVCLSPLFAGFTFASPVGDGHRRAFFSIYEYFSNIRHTCTSSHCPWLLPRCTNLT